MVHLYHDILSGAFVSSLATRRRLQDVSAVSLSGMVAAEIFRSPTAVMTREALPGTPSVAAAAHLAVRNMVAGIGPLAVAFLASKYDLQHAMLFAPVFYAFAGVAYFDAIGTLTEEKEQITAAEQR